MAIYHLHVKNISRGDGRSAVAAAAYRAGETLPNEAEERDSAFGGRRDVLHAELRLPAGAPAWMGERAPLWNAVEAAEKRKDSRLAKEIEFALPRELTFPVWLELARQMADVYTLRGHAVDLAIHADAAGQNPHAHLMMTTRAIDPTGFGRKLREADALAFVNEARALWAQLANAALGKAGAGVEIDPRSLAARGEERAAGRHRGPDQEERRARRAERMTMDPETAEARRQLLAEKDVRQRYPLLAARADWPPENRAAVPGLSMPELAEYRAFWRDVSTRLFEGVAREPAPRAPDPDAPRYERDEHGPAARREARLVAQALRGDTVREATIEAALPTWRELHQAVMDRMVADGFDVSDVKWEGIVAAMQRFDRQLSEIHEREARNAAHRPMGRFDDPVPDPDGRPIAKEQLYAAELAMLEEVAQREFAVPPEPGIPPAAERAAAAAAVERMNTVEVSDDRAAQYRVAPQEDNLDWLREAEPEPRQGQPDYEPVWARDRERDRGR